MKFRQTFFSILAGLTLLLMCGALALGSEAFSNTVDQYEGPDEYADANEAGAAIGAGIGISMMLCVLVPFLLVFSLLAWRNSVGLKNEARHRETLAVQAAQIAALQAVASQRKEAP